MSCCKMSFSFAYPSLLLQEFFHIVRQRYASRIRQILFYNFHGNQNFEQLVIKSKQTIFAMKILLGGNIL